MAKKRERRQLPPTEPVEALPEVLQRSGLAERGARRRRKRDRSWDAQRSKATYDLPAELIERVREIAAELGQAGARVKVSDIARLLLEAGLEQYETGQLEVDLKPTGYTLFDD